jgi:hypothetical protein
MDSSNDFYTLSYSPHDFRYDNSWHKVKVTLNGNAYNLSYRHGYFADGNDPHNKAEDPQPSGSRTKLLANGETARFCYAECGREATSHNGGRSDGV